MSRRQRVPRRKQLGGHRRERNANPKLSPYQREQKRDKMANQAPVSLQTRDFPAKARRLQMFLEKGRDKKSAKSDKEEEALRAMRNRKPEEWEVDFEPTTLAPPTAGAVAQDVAPDAPLANADDYGEPESSRASSFASIVNSSDEEDSDNEAEAAAPAKTRSQKAPSDKPDAMGAVSLNSALHAEPTAESEEVLKRLERKKLKALKKKEQRREDRVDKLKAKEEALSVLLNKKKRKDEDVRENAYQAVKEASRNTRRKKGKKRAERKKEAEPETLPPTTNERRDFDDMVDYVGFGERSDAPPKFDSVPTAHPALIPTQGMGKAKHQKLVQDARRDKIRRLTHQAMPPTGAGKKTTTLPDGTIAPFVKNSKLESADDFAALRERVMARYSKANAGTFNQRRRAIKFTVGGEPIE